MQKISSMTCFHGCHGFFCPLAEAASVGPPSIYKHNWLATLPCVFENITISCGSASCSASLPRRLVYVLTNLCPNIQSKSAIYKNYSGTYRANISCSMLPAFAVISKYMMHIQNYKAD